MHAYYYTNLTNKQYIQKKDIRSTECNTLVIYSNEDPIPCVCNHCNSYSNDHYNVAMALLAKFIDRNNIID